MSGIFGIIRPPGQLVSEHELAAMSGTLAHRGPDGLSFQCWGNIGLGHCMLYTTEESLSETLPLRDSASGVSITADARLDNRDELIKALATAGMKTCEPSDSQLILMAYHRWGDRCTDHFLGDYAFVVHDARSGQFLIARDHMGIKPLYHYFADGFFVFASSAQAIAQVQGVHTRLSDARIVDFLAEELEGVDKTSTFFENIYRLPPATQATCNSRALISRRYWEPDASSTLELGTDEEYQEAFFSVYREAVRARLRSHRPAASMLSGGLDSSTIVALARDIIQDSGSPMLKTVSAVSDDACCPESAAIQAVIRQGGISAVTLDARAALRMKDDLFQTLELLEDPFDCFQTVPALMYMQAGRDGARVVLDGVDGDSVTGINYGYSTQLVKQGQWSRAWKEASGLSRHAYCGDISAEKIFLEAAASALVPEKIKRIRRSLLGSKQYSALVEGKYIESSFARQAGLPVRFEESLRSGRNPASASLSAVHSSRLESPVLTVGLERYERVAGYFGVEARHPLMDKRVVEFCLSMPWQQKVRNGWLKYQLRLLADGLLPQTVAWGEGRRHVGWEISQRLLDNSRDWLEGQLNAIQDEAPVFVDVGLLSESKAGMISLTDENARARVWRLYCLLYWMKRVELN